MSDIEVIEIFFDPIKENIDWEIRKLNHVNNIRIKETDVKKNDFSHITGSATVYVTCQFCHQKIDNSTYSKHLQEIHPDEYFIIKEKQRISGNSHIKGNKKKKNKQIKEIITESKSPKVDNKPKSSSQIPSTVRNESFKVTVETISLPKKDNSQKVFSKDLSKVKSITCPFCKANLDSNSVKFITHMQTYHNRDFYSSVYGDGSLLKCKSCKSIINGCHPLVIVKHISKNCYSQANTSGNFKQNNVIDEHYFESTINPNYNIPQFSERGAEIQARLQDLRVEIKQQGNIKLYRDNIRKELLDLQKEMTENAEKFNKIDNIHIRLVQIDDYLDKLNKLDEKEIEETLFMNLIENQLPKKTTIKNQEPSKNETQNINSNSNSTTSGKKNKMKVIWSHSLS